MRGDARESIPSPFFNRFSSYYIYNVRAHDVKDIEKLIDETNMQNNS